MSQVEAPRGRTCSRRLRSVALLASGVLALPALAACTAEDDGSSAKPPAQDIAPAGRGATADGGTVRWAVDTVPATLNAFQADADATTGRIAAATLPALFTVDERGRPVRNPDYLESAEVVEREPKQVVLYKINQQAVWSDGREIGAPDFLAQWRALSGKDSAYWTARNAGYERIERIERGTDDLEVKVTFTKPYADWESLFTPLYPKEVTATAAAFNDGARTELPATAGPFRIEKVDRDGGATTLVRNPRWWGERAKLDSLVLTAVPREERIAALTAGKLDVADIDRQAAERISYAAKDAGRGGKPLAHGPGSDLTPSAALRSWALAHGSDEGVAETARAARERTAKAQARYAEEQSVLRGYRVRKSLEPAYTQLAMNGESGPLADDRVRRAVARAIDRDELAETVLGPLGLPAHPPGSHLALAGQPHYKDSSGALGEQNTQEAQALLTAAGWTPGGALEKKPAEAAGAEKDATGKSASEDASEKDENKDEDGAGQSDKPGGADNASDEGLYIVGDDKPATDTRLREHAPTGTRVIAPAPAAALQSLALERQARALTESDSGASEDSDSTATARGQEKGDGMAGAYAPRGTAAPSPAAAGGAVGKDGKPLTLRFVLPSGPGSEQVRSVGTKISRMLERIGIRTEVTKVADESYFKDHVASGDYDLALYSWPASAYPATDARPIYAKPRPASDGSLLVEQNYTRVGTDYIDQLFDQAAGELDDKAARELMHRADARIWAAAGSVPIYQRPDLVAVKSSLANVGAFGFETPRYQDIGYRKPSGGPEKPAGTPSEQPGTATGSPAGESSTP